MLGDVSIKVVLNIPTNSYIFQNQEKMFSFISKIFKSKNADKVAIKSDTIDHNMQILYCMIHYLNLLEHSMTSCQPNNKYFFENAGEGLKIFKSCSMKFLQVLNKEILEIQKSVDLKQEILMSMMDNKKAFGVDLEELIRNLMQEMKRLNLYDETKMGEGDSVEVQEKIQLKSEILELNQALKLQAEKMDQIIECMKNECKQIVEGGKFEPSLDLFE